MARLTKDAMFRTFRPVAELNLDKTTRVVREMTEAFAYDHKVPQSGYPKG